MGGFGLLDLLFGVLGGVGLPIIVDRLSDARDELLVVGVTGGVRYPFGGVGRGVPTKVEMGGEAMAEREAEGGGIVPALGLVMCERMSDWIEMLDGRRKVSRGWEPPAGRAT